MSEAEPEREVIEIAYGHPSGAVQASHPESNLKQLGESPGEAVDELWALLKEAGVVEEDGATEGE